MLSLPEVLPTGGSSEKAVYLLLKNKNVGLFPEGSRSHDGKIKEFKRGAALLALKTGRPVVPCAICGDYQALPRKERFPRFVPLRIKIGKPLYFLREFDELVDDVCLQDGIHKIRKAIQRMLYAG